MGKRHWRRKRYTPPEVAEFQEVVASEDFKAIAPSSALWTEIVAHTVADVCAALGPVLKAEDIDTVESFKTTAVAYKHAKALKEEGNICMQQAARMMVPDPDTQHPHGSLYGSGAATSTLKHHISMKFAGAGKIYADALKTYSEAIDMVGSSHILFSNRAAVRQSLQDFEGALSDALRCIRVRVVNGTISPCVLHHMQSLRSQRVLLSWYLQVYRD